MITERHLFRLFLNDQIQVPTLLHSICACIDTSEDPSSLSSSLMLLVLLLQQSLPPVKQLFAAALKMLRCSKLSSDRKRFLCVLLLRYAAGRYLDFLKFDEQLAVFLTQLFDASEQLSKASNERIAERISLELEELSRVLSASPYSRLRSPVETPQKPWTTSRPSEGAKTARSTTTGTPSPEKPHYGVFLLSQLRQSLSEVTEAVPNALRHKVTEFASKKVKEVVDLCEKYDAKTDDVIEDYIRTLIATIENLAAVVKNGERITRRELEALLSSCVQMPEIRDSR